MPFDFRGVSSSGSSNPRRLPIKTWHSATIEIHGLFYEAAPAPPLHMGGNRTQHRLWDPPGRGAGETSGTFPVIPGRIWNAQMHGWARVAGQGCALFLWRIPQAEKAPPASWASASAPAESFDSAQKQTDLIAITQHHNEVWKL